jgi:Ca2+-dependent lipid-binding protein
MFNQVCNIENIKKEWLDQLEKEKKVSQIYFMIKFISLG